MANRNKQIIISYFPREEIAEDVAQQVKDWDKAHDDIKLGGLGILTWHNGKIKTRLVGNRATGTGAKWGLILGGVTGILSGGITLIGGIAAGVVAGSVLGLLFHKHLGLTDADKDRLSQHLMAGGAAIVIMADEHEVEPTKAELARLGGQVEDYEIPEEVVDQVEASTEIGPLEGETLQLVDERTLVAVNDIPAITGLNGSLKTVEGIGAVRSATLAAVGVTSKKALLDRGATPEGRAELASQSQISEALISNWVSAIDLSRVKGIGGQYGQLLTQVGVNSVSDLAQQDAASLHERLVAANAAGNLVRELAGVSKIEDWITQARALQPVIKS